MKWSSQGWVVKWRETKSYTIPGEIKVASGDTDYILPFYWSNIPPGQTVTLKAVYGRLNSGTSVAGKLRCRPHGGAEADLASPYDAMTVNAVGEVDPNEFTGDVVIAAKDRYRFVPVTPTGTPTHLTLTFDYEVVVSG